VKDPAFGRRRPAAPAVSLRKALPRRHLLRAAGVALALPLLDVMTPPFAHAGRATGGRAAAKPRRFLGICNNLSLMPELFNPKGEGRAYVASPYTKIIEPHRNDFTVLTGVSHPNVDGQHAGDICFLTAAPHPASGSFRNTMSLDQLIAEQLGSATRFPSLTLAVNSRTRSLSWTASGVAIPPEDSAAAVFRQLFMQGTQAEVEAKLQSIADGRSVLDAVAGLATKIDKAASARDRARLEQYLTSVREMERRLAASRRWERTPKPKPRGAAPVDPAEPEAFFEKTEAMYQMARLAFESDSTRAISLMLNSVDTPIIELPGGIIRDDYHSLSHHGKSEEKQRQLRAIEETHMQLLGRLFGGLKEVREGEDALLDRSIIVYGSHMGDANIHVNTNLPVIVAGGGFRHGQHLAFDKLQNYPLPNLFVSVLQRMGIERDSFASSTGTMKGLELA
jgi:hypothetical protein